MLRKIRSLIAKPALIVAAICLSAQMFGTCGDVLLRLFFRKSILGIYESMEAFMMYATFMSLVYAYSTRLGLIQVDLFFNRLSERGRRIANAIVLILSLALFIFLCYSASVATYQDFIMGEYRHGIVQFPLWPMKLSEAIGGILMVILITANIIEEMVVRRPAENPSA